MPVHGAEAGYLGELTVDRAIAGRVVPWIPVVDAHGIDRAYSWMGAGPPALVQIKTATVLGSEGYYEWTMRVDALHRHHRFFVVLVGLPPSPWREPTFWCLNGATLARLASQTYDRRKRTGLYVVRASPVRLDKFARYRVTADQLVARLFPDADLSAPPLRLPILKVDKGGVYEFATITDVLTRNRKDLLALRPAFDMHGRDLLVHLVGTAYAIYLQVKGTERIQGRDRAQVLIRRATFQPADDFWLVVRLGSRRAGSVLPDSWLIPSWEVVRRTAHERERDFIMVKVSLDPSRDPFADCRHASDDIAQVLRGALAGRRAA